MSLEGEHRLEDAELDEAIVGGNPMGETETRRLAHVTRRLVEQGIAKRMGKNRVALKRRTGSILRMLVELISQR